MWIIWVYYILKQNINNERTSDSRDLEMYITVCTAIKISKQAHGYFAITKLIIIIMHYSCSYDVYNIDSKLFVTSHTVLDSTDI